MHRLLPLLALTVAVAIAGCGGVLGGDTTPEPTATPAEMETATETPTPTPTPEPTASDNVSLPDSWNTQTERETPPPLEHPDATPGPVQQADTPTPESTATPTPTPTATHTPTPTPTPDPPTVEDLRVSHSDVRLTDDAAVVNYTLTNTHEQTVRAYLEVSIQGEPGNPNSPAYRENRTVTLYQTPTDLEYVIHGGEAVEVRIPYDGDRWQNATDTRHEVRIEES